MPYCKLYDIGMKRIGCVLCPMASRAAKEFERERYPGIERAYKKAIRYLIDTRGYYDNIGDENEVFEWWISNRSVKDFLKRKQQQEDENGNIEGG